MPHKLAWAMSWPNYCICLVVIHCLGLLLEYIMTHRVGLLLPKMLLCFWYDWLHCPLALLELMLCIGHNYVIKAMPYFWCKFDAFNWSICNKYFCNNRYVVYWTGYDLYPAAVLPGAASRISYQVQYNSKPSPHYFWRAQHIQYNNKCYETTHPQWSEWKGTEPSLM